MGCSSLPAGTGHQPVTTRPAPTPAPTTSAPTTSTTASPSTTSSLTTTTTTTSSSLSTTTTKPTVPAPGATQVATEFLKALYTWNSAEFKLLGPNLNAVLVKRYAPFVSPGLDSMLTGVIAGPETSANVS